MELSTIIWIILSGLFINGIIYKVYDDVFEDMENALSKIHLKGLIRFLAIIPFSLMFILIGQMLLLLLGVVLISIGQTFVLFYKGLQSLIRGKNGS